MIVLRDNALQKHVALDTADRERLNEVLRVEAHIFPSIDLPSSQLFLFLFYLLRLLSSFSRKFEFVDRRPKSSFDFEKKKNRRAKTSNDVKSIAIATIIK